jgi:hypothetical protein
MQIPSGPEQDSGDWRAYQTNCQYQIVVFEIVASLMISLPGKSNYSMRKGQNMN